jgi:hypothetical protein
MTEAIGRPLSWRSLLTCCCAAALLLVVSIGTTRFDGRNRLSAAELFSSRGNNPGYQTGSFICNNLTQSQNLVLTFRTSALNFPPISIARPERGGETAVADACASGKMRGRQTFRSQTVDVPS